MTTLAEGQQQIFIIPNGTFFVELIIFGIVLLVLWKAILPPIQRALKERHDTAQQAIDDSDAAKKKLKAAEESYREALAEARAESGRIRDESRASGQRVLDEMKAEAQSEADAIRREGEQQLAGQRERVLGELYGEIGRLSTTLANRMVNGDVTRAAGHQATVDEFVGSLGSGAAAGSAAGKGGAQ